jgi:DNA topoisomerase-1
MAKKLVVVESPAKARTISRILGRGYDIKATLGHVRDLPKSELGIDIDNDFTPRYIIIRQRRPIITELKKSAAGAAEIYLATDPDREGEAISWHLIEAAKLDNGNIPIHRVVFHEITKEAVEKAFLHPRSIDMNLVDAQQARRLLDRLVGYKLSPLLWRKVQRGLSAGRVQSAALRMIIDREREIQNFIAVEFWTIEAELAKSLSDTPKNRFRALLVGLVNGKKIAISNQQEAQSIQDELRKADYKVKKVTVKEVARQPAPPFTTSTLQQEAWRKLRFSAQRTMLIAQQLYEGVPLGEEGAVGLITYMRTDSTHVAASAIAEARDFIAGKYGNRFVPANPRHFAKKGKWAQEAHEAIRPTKIHREPDHIRSYLKPEQLKLYDLIWKRMVASQMAAALMDATTVEVEADAAPHNIYLLKASSSVVKFPGFITVYTEGKDEEAEEEQPVILPLLKDGDQLVLLNLFPEQRFTQPPLRYNEATLIKALEQKGIGRPSTYAPILSTIQERGYIFKEKGRLCPDEIGFIVSDLLTEHFPKIVDLDFTAQLEEELDEIARGERNWASTLKDFYKPFEETLNKASSKIEKISVAKPTEEVCPECGRPMVLKTGRFGKFLACSGYPECKKTMTYMVKTGVSCPICGKEIVERTTKKKRIFYGCSGYPQCRFALNRRPVTNPCPQCGKMLVIYRDGWVKCTACEYKAKLEGVEKIGAAA